MEAYNRAFAGVLELEPPREEEISNFHDTLRPRERERHGPRRAQDCHDPMAGGRRSRESSSGLCPTITTSP